MRIRRAVAAVFTATALLTTFLATLETPAGAVVAGVNGRVAFVSNRDGDNEIFAMRVDGTGVTQLTFNTSNDYDPAFSSFGNRIAFVSDRSGSPELYTMNADGSSQTRISTNSMSESHPTWAPTDGLIAFAGLIGTDSDIYKGRPEGGPFGDMTPDPVAFDTNPSWSPGGIYIVFESTNRNGNPGTDIYKMKNDATQITRLTTTGKDSNPAWAPDNKNLTFQSARDAQSGGPSVFALVNQPNAVAVTANGVLVTQFNTDKVRTLDSSGNMTTFADLPPTGNADLERYIAISPGLGGFPQDYVYVTVGKDTYKISPDGLTVTPFVHIESMPPGETGITFDTVGTFGFKMILTDRRGPVWTVDSGGSATQICDVGKQIEGPLVAPTSFVPFGGQVLVGNEFTDSLFAVSNGTPCVVSTVGTWDSPEQALQVPATPCNFGTSGGALFIAMKDQNEIIKFPASDFVGIGNDVITPSELATDIGRFHSNGATIQVSQFWEPIGTPDLEGSGFAPCASGRAGASMDTVPGPHDIYTMTSTGTNQTRLTTDPADDARPAYSPDGLQIVFQSDRDDPGQPTCEASGTCKYETYSMNASNGTGQTNFSDNPSANDTSPDWESVSRVVTVGDFFYNPVNGKPALGGSVLWDFLGPTSHTATDDSGMGLFDSGTKASGAYFVFRFVAAGNYPVTCTIHPTQMSGTIKVPIRVAPVSGSEATVFTITWGGASPPSGYRFDVQILRPGAADWADWKTNQTSKSSTFVADSGPGTYSFRGRLRNTANGFASDYSAPMSITVS